MRKTARWAAASLLLLLACVPAAAAGPARSPVGSWQTADGQARVHVTMCGDGTQLCAKLTGVSGDARTAKNLGLINSYVVDRAAMADANSWQGVVHFGGHTAQGNITLRSANTIAVSGCELGMCKTFMFKRI
jgi:uncharacterized protein (DUF2147 family)